MFKIKNLEVSINDKKIIKDFNIELNPGELHVIMGRNGTGKSSLANVIAGEEKYKIIDGNIIFCDKDLFSGAIFNIVYILIITQSNFFNLI